MLTLKTSVAALAVAAGLTLCLAPHTAFADDAPTGSSMGGVASPDSPVGQMEKHLDDIKKADAKLNPPKKVVVPPPAPPAPPPSPGVLDRFFHWIDVTFLGGVEDEAKAQKEHNAAVDKLVEERRKAAEEQKKLEQQKTELHKTAVAPAELKNVELKTVEAKKIETIEIPAATKPATKIVLPDAPKPAEINLNTVENIKAKINEPVDVPAATKPVMKIVPTDTPKPAEINLNTVEKLKAMSNESVDVLTPKSTKKLVPTEVTKVKISTPLRPTETTVSHLEVSRPMVNVHPTINIPRPTINIPVVVRR
ncbi:MAG TPA: hypothetical protein VK834_05840 [Bradyrhizobium sp.]|jgi:hypothetical protein|nr:hypothetical protein [Bradyrhizobium sp.]